MSSGRNYFYMTRLDIRRDSGYDRYGVGDINMMTRGGGDQCQVTICATVNIEQAQFLQDAMREGIELQVTPAGGSQYTFMPPIFTTTTLNPCTCKGGTGVEE